MNFSRQSGVDATERFIRKLVNLRATLAPSAEGLPLLEAPLKALSRIEAVLRRPLRLAILGEANSGKSTLTNLLLGVPVLPALQVPNTRVPTLIVYGERAELFHRVSDDDADPHSPINGELVYLRLPLEPLKTCQILDVPGVLDPLLGYDVADIKGFGVNAAIWCTFSTQAWKETERLSWSRLPERVRKMGLLAVTHTDFLRDGQTERVRARLKSVAEPEFNGLVFVSSLQAIEAFDASGNLVDTELWAKSGAAELSRALQEQLGRLRMQRLQNAQALMRRIAEKALSRIPA